MKNHHWFSNHDQYSKITTFQTLIESIQLILNLSSLYFMIICHHGWFEFEINSVLTWREIGNEQFVDTLHFRVRPWILMKRYLYFIINGSDSTFNVKSRAHLNNLNKKKNRKSKKKNKKKLKTKTLTRNNENIIQNEADTILEKIYWLPRPIKEKNKTVENNTVRGSSSVHYDTVNQWIVEPRHDKTNKMTVRTAKPQISRGIRQVWSESSLCTQWVAKDPSFLHADSERAHSFCWFCHVVAQLCSNCSKGKSRSRLFGLICLTEYLWLLTGLHWHAQTSVDTLVVGMDTPTNRIKLQFLIISCILLLFLDFNTALPRGPTLNFCYKLCHMLSWFMIYTIRKKLSIIFFCDEIIKNFPFPVASDHTEFFRACIWEVCLDAAKIIEVPRISFLSYGGYKMP